MSEAEFAGGTDSGRTRFRRTLIRVLAVQLAALILLWLLQARYGG